MTPSMPTGVHPPILGFAARSGAGKTTRRRLAPRGAGRQTGRNPPMLTNAHLPILGFAAWSGTGKTALRQRLAPGGAGRQTGRDSRC